LGNSHEFYTYIGNDQFNDDDDGIVEEFTTGSGERHVVIMTKNDANLSMQEKFVFSLKFVFLTIWKEDREIAWAYY